MERCCLDCPLVLFTLGFQTRLAKATTKKRYSDTTIQRYTEPEPELEPCINYANYCLQSPWETSVKIFSGGGAYTQKYFL